MTTASATREALAAAASPGWQIELLNVTTDADLNATFAGVRRGSLVAARGARAAAADAGDWVPQLPVARGLTATAPLALRRAMFHLEIKAVAVRSFNEEILQS